MFGGGGANFFCCHESIAFSNRKLGLMALLSIIILQNVPTEAEQNYFLILPFPVTST